MKLRAGFTLIEILVVIAIIGILSSVIIASLNTARERARNASYLVQIREYQKALALYYTNQGSYPGTSAWGCIGTGFPGGVCWNSSGYNESNTTSVSLRAALAPYIDVTSVPGPTGKTFGPMYRPNSGGYEFIVILEGDIACPVGVKAGGGTYSAYGITRCNLSSQGL